ncbi:MAG: hypothetical protein EOO73_01340 [Myxococcales bacterium]|nr:MAG: hypothetical protein EOO73_01340 [Myxococcales bacterium]
MKHSERRSGRRVGAWLVASAFATCAVYPAIARLLAAHRAAAAVNRARATPSPRSLSASRDTELSLRVERLEGLLASWQTIGGCGAGTSTSSGGGLKWIGHSVSGGLFNLQTQASYAHLDDGYIATFNTQISREVTERWALGVSAPILYKYYRSYKALPVDVSNAGVGDTSAFVTRKFGEIKATALTLTVGFPTGTYKAAYKNDYLSQEKQLGIGRLTGSLSLDHTMDEQWGVIVVGAAGGYRGGKNALGNYRAPFANAYGYIGYFTGPFVPSLGLTLQRYFGVDRDRGLEQQMRLMLLTAQAAIEWSTDTVAVLGGVSVPFGWEAGAPAPGGAVATAQGPGFQPWTVGVGLTLSPF